MIAASSEKSYEQVAMARRRIHHRQIEGRQGITHRGAAAARGVGLARMMASQVRSA